MYMYNPFPISDWWWATNGSFCWTAECLELQNGIKSLGLMKKTWQGCLASALGSSLVSVSLRHDPGTEVQMAYFSRNLWRKFNLIDLHSVWIVLGQNQAISSRCLILFKCIIIFLASSSQLGHVLSTNVLWGSFKKQTLQKSYSYRYLWFSLE